MGLLLVGQSSSHQPRVLGGVQSHLLRKRPSLSLTACKVDRGGARLSDNNSSANGVDRSLAPQIACNPVISDSRQGHAYCCVGQSARTPLLLARRRDRQAFTLVSSWTATATKDGLVHHQLTRRASNAFSNDLQLQSRLGWERAGGLRSAAYSWDSQQAHLSPEAPDAQSDSDCTNWSTHSKRPLSRNRCRCCPLQFILKHTHTYTHTSAREFIRLHGPPHAQQDSNGGQGGYSQEDALAAALAKIEMLEQQVQLVESLQEVTEEQDGLITQLKALLDARSMDKAQLVHSLASTTRISFKAQFHCGSSACVCSCVSVLSCGFRVSELQTQLYFMTKDVIRKA
eukprot:1159182-Pelagomonas_calceolata.AAC.1